MLKCPKCGCTAYQKRGKDRKGCNVYKCKKCNSAFMSPEDYSYNSANSRAEVRSCPNCKSKLIKDGFNKGGGQKFRCLNCSSHFSVDKKQRGKIHKELEDKIKFYLQLKGIQQKDIAKHFNVGRNTVLRIKKREGEKNVQ